MTERMDRRFAALKQGRPRRARHLHHGGRSRRSHVARHPQGAAEGRRRRDRARHAVHRSDGRRAGDPGRGPARASCRRQHEEDACHRARIPRRRRRDADRADGLLQSDLRLRRRKISRRCQGRRRRWADRRRSAAGGGRRALPAGASRPASISSASPRRPPTTSGCRPCSPIRRASSTTSRSPALPAPPRRTRPRFPAAVARIKRHTKLPVCVGFGVRTAEQARAIAAGADGVVVGSALVDAVRKSLGPGDKPTAATVPAVTDLVRELAEGVRSSRV